MSAEKMLLKEEENLESLLPRLAEIKTWQKDINAAKGNKSKVAELRKSFRAVFGVSFGQKLVADLNRLEKGETAEQIKNQKEKEKGPLQPLKTVLKKSKELQTEVKEQQALEAVSAKDIVDPKLQESTLHIDEQKKEVVTDTIALAETIALKAVGNNSKEKNKKENKKVVPPSPEVKKTPEKEKNELVVADVERGDDNDEALSNEILATRDTVLSDIDAGYQAELKANAAEEAEKEAEWDEQDEEALRQEILATKDKVLADIEAGYQAELAANVAESGKKNINADASTLESAYSGLREKDNALRTRVSDCPDFNSLISLVQGLTESDFAVDSFPVDSMVENLKKVEKKYQERLVEGNTVYTEPSFIPNDYGLKEQTKIIWENMVAARNIENGLISVVDAKNPESAVVAKNTENSLSSTANLEKPEGAKEEKQMEIIPEALEYFYSLGLDEKDLQTIPGLSELNGVSQLLIAKSLKNLALEKANKNVAQKQAESAASAKGFFGKLGAGIANSFKLGRQKKESLEGQMQGGLSEHKVELTRLVDWAKIFNLKEVKTEEGKLRADFTGGFDREQLSEEQKQIVEDFNKRANIFSSFAKEHRLFSSKEPKGSESHQEFYLARRDYLVAREKMGNLLSNGLKWQESKVLAELNKADANVNMVQFMSANPELEKDWQEMLENKSVLAKAFSKDNWKFLAGGYAGRMALAGSLGFVAIPVVAATIGAWRGRDRGHKNLRAEDKALDKKEISKSPILAQRQEVLKQIQKLVPTEFALDRKAWLQIASPEEKAAYLQLATEFNRLDNSWRKEENKKTERKTLTADTLMSKLQTLIDKINKIDSTNTEEDRELLFLQLSRRLDFTKDLADRGLINFGSMEERSSRMLDFYQFLSIGQEMLLTRNDESIVLISRSEKEDVYEDRKNIIINELKERAEDLLNSLEYYSELKLDKKRRSFIKQKMIQGATMGAVFSGLGASLHHLSGGWVEDKISSGFRFVADNTGIDEALSAAGQAMHLDQALAALAGVKHQAGEYLNNLTGGQSVEVVVPAASAKDSTVEAIVDDTVVNNSAPVLETSEPVAAPTTWSDQISNESLKAGQHDSVWRSTREIFKGHAQELGYEGDIQDSASLQKWADIQTNRALADSGDISDKVFEGNQVTLEKSGDGFVVKVEAGSGAQPGHLPEVQAEAPTDSGLEDIQEQPIIVNEVPESRSDPFFASNDLERVGSNKEIWADKAGSRFGLSNEQVSYADENVIKANIKGHDVFIDTKTNTFLFFDDNANEVSGLLFDDNGHLINNAQEFLGNKFFSEEMTTSEFLTNRLAGVGGTEQEVAAASSEAEAAVINEQPTASAPINSPEQPANLSGGQNPTGSSETAPDIQDQFNNIVTEHAERTGGGSIRETLEAIASQKKTLADKVLLEYIEENNISTDQSLRTLLANDNSLMMAMRSPETSVLTQLYDLRHASSGDAQAEMMYKYLHTALSEDLNDAGKLARFDKLASLNSFRVGSSLDGKIDSFVMQLGDNVRKVDFSAKGMSEVVKFVKQIL